jgi:hypothetical protein
MLRLYLRSLGPCDKAGCVRLAEETAQHYHKRAMKQRGGAGRLSQTLESVELCEFLRVLLPDDQTARLISGAVRAGSLAAALLAAWDIAGDLPVVRLRFLLSLTLPVMSLDARMREVFDAIGIPESRRYPVRLGVMALLHTVLILASHRTRLDPLEVLWGAACSAAAFHGMRWFMKAAEAVAPMVLCRVLMFGLGCVVGPLVLRLVRDGPLTALERMIEKIVSVLGSFAGADDPLEDLPVNCSVPDALRCCICHFNLNEPVVLLGFFFCETCLHRAVKEQWTHPCTREEITPEMVDDPFVMRRVARKWHILALQEIRLARTEED